MTLPESIQAAALYALDPIGIGGISVRAPAGPARARWLVVLQQMLEGPVRKLPANIAEDRLLGGIDLAATLAAGAPRHQAGALVQSDGGTILLAMAERLPPATAARIAQAQDTASVDGTSTQFGFILLDEGIDDEAPSASLLDRAALHLDLTATPLAAAEPLDLEAARARLATVTIPDDALEALCSTALALGVTSGRAPFFAFRAARAAAALAGRTEATPEDIALAARLVLAPRATTLPAEAPPPDPPPPDPTQDLPDPTQGQPLADQVLDAAKAAIPPGLLALLHSASPAARHPGRAGAAIRGTSGRPAGTRPGLPQDGLRLDLLATLRAAAPWQRLRNPNHQPRLQIRRDDLRITHRQQKAGTTTIFLVDASGSHALNRLAEAKGAVELLLADCYIRRDQVAVLAFRGKQAELVLPPTRSLVRAKRSLAGLPGGGGTPLATGIDAGFQLADTVRRRGGTPTLVLLTDGQANVARDGTGGRARARDDADKSARLLRASGLKSIFLDTSPRPSAVARAIAQSMAARYVPLPYASGATLSQTIRALR